MTLYRPRNSIEHSYMTSTTYLGAGPQWRSSIPLFTVINVKEILHQERSRNPLSWRSRYFYVIKVKKILRTSRRSRKSCHEGEGNPVINPMSSRFRKSYVINFHILIQQLSLNLTTFCLAPSCIHGNRWLTFSSGIWAPPVHFLRPWLDQQYCHRNRFRI